MKHFEHRAALLRSARRRTNLSQHKLGKAIGVHHQYVSNWERGLCAPPEEKLKPLLKQLNLAKKIMIHAELLDMEAELREKYA